MNHAEPVDSNGIGDESETRIPKRNISFGIGRQPAPKWCDDNEVRTAFFDAFSLFLPEGERFFIRSVHAYADNVTDPRLREDIKAFSAQEAYHTREHEAYNRAIQDEGLPLADVYGRIRKLLATVKGKLECLSVTVGLEHLTACLGYITLKYPEILAHSDPRYRELWTWHALEEIEHKAVAFEVFQVASAKLPRWQAYFLRCGAMLTATHYIARMQLELALELLQVRGYATSWKTKVALLWVMLGTPGYYRRILWYYLQFLKPNFFPAGGAESAYARPWREYFNERAMKHQDDHA